MKKMGSTTISGSFFLQGAQLRWEGSVVRCHEECEITDHSTLLQADDLDYDTHTGETTARGNVRMKFIGTFAAPAPETR